MACLYRPRVTTWKLNGRCRTPDGKRVTKATPGAVRVDEGASATWYGKFTLPSGEVRRVKLATDKTASKQILAKLVVDAKLAEHDLGGRFVEHAKRPLIEHLADYRAYLTAKGNTPGHVQLTATRALACLNGCGFVRAVDVGPSAVVGFLAELRVTKSIATANYYLVALKGFTRWLWKDRRIVSDPLAGLSKLANGAADIRRERRELSMPELDSLTAAARASDRAICGLTGPARSVLYLTAAATGFRAAELASLSRESFDLNGDAPTVRVAAAYTKNRKEVSQPIPPALADGLNAYLSDRTDADPLWPGQWAKNRHGAEMIRADLADARAMWILLAQNARQRDERERSDFCLYRDAEGRYADFHALRHTFISMVVRSGASAKTAQTLARHSTVQLTLGRYAHVSCHDTTAAVNALPLSRPDRRQRETLAATGTDGRAPDRALTKRVRFRGFS